MRLICSFVGRSNQDSPDKQSIMYMYTFKRFAIEIGSLDYESKIDPWFAICRMEIQENW